MGSYLAKIKDISSYYKKISSVSLLYPVCLHPDSQLCGCSWDFGSNSESLVFFRTWPC